MSYIIYFIIIMFVPLMVQIYLKRTYAENMKIQASSGLTGAEAARKVLNENGLYNVNIEEVSGNLTDHYDPRKKVLRLSSNNYHGTSVAAVCVSVHEVGHAIQDKQGYALLRFRHAFIPVANIGSNFSWLLIMLGIIFSSTNMLFLGIAAMSAAVVFQVVTLPVEFNASSRALTIMNNSGLVTNDEGKSARKVLNAAALTYIAGTFVAVMELLRFVLMFVGMKKND